MFDAHRVEHEIERLHGRKRLAIVHGALAARLAGNVGTRSMLEDRFAAIIAASGLAMPDAGAPVESLEVDFLWRAQRLVVEIDGPHHLQPHSMKRDPARDRLLRDAGFEILRYTAHDIDHHREHIVSTLTHRLQQQRAGEPPNAHYSDHLNAYAVGRKRGSPLART